MTYDLLIDDMIYSCILCSTKTLIIINKCFKKEKPFP